jgi:mannose-6-phosphate isomerase
MGTHPRGGSTAVIPAEESSSAAPAGDQSLARLLRQFPEAWGGTDASGQPVSELPFLFKILSVGKPLSLQCHPDSMQAREGFLREEAQGIPADAPNRTYKDPHHKPEIICAMTPFIAMCGFRSLQEIDALFMQSGSRWYLMYLRPLVQDRMVREKERYRRLMERLLSLGQPQKLQILEDIGRKIAERGLCTDAPDCPFALVSRLMEIYPGDVGVLAPLFLRVLQLEPGEALYLPAGELHGYVSGMGAELMANSDNVVRGGLTEKYVDTAELLRILRYEEGNGKKLYPAPADSAADAAGTGLLQYRTPADDFVLRKSSGGQWTCRNRTHIELCIVTAGEAEFTYTDAERNREISKVLKKGEAAVIPAAVKSYSCRCSGELFSASYSDAYGKENADIKANPDGKGKS